MVQIQQQWQIFTVQNFMPSPNQVREDHNLFCQAKHFHSIAMQWTKDLQFGKLFLSLDARHSARIPARASKMHRVFMKCIMHTIQMQRVVTQHGSHRSIHNLQRQCHSLSGEKSITFVTLAGEGIVIQVAAFCLHRLHQTQLANCF